MSDFYKINVTKLKEYYEKFNNEKVYYNNATLKTFSSSYIKSCSSSEVIKMRNALNTIYQDIKRGYDNIDTWWQDYNNNVEALEKTLAISVSASTIKKNTIRSYVINNIPELKSYKKADVVFTASLLNNPNFVNRVFVNDGGSKSTINIISGEMFEKRGEMLKKRIQENLAKIDKLEEIRHNLQILPGIVPEEVNNEYIGKLNKIRDAIINLGFDCETCIDYGNAWWSCDLAIDNAINKVMQDIEQIKEQRKFDILEFFDNQAALGLYGCAQDGITSLFNYTYIDPSGSEFPCIYGYDQVKFIIKDCQERGDVVPAFICDVKPECKAEFEELEKSLIKKGFTKEQAHIIMFSVNDLGACSYAAKANVIFEQFMYSPDLFEQKFGFPMYKSDGTLNSNMLLLDMYVYCNDKANGGKLFEYKNGSYIFSQGYLKDENDQVIYDENGSPLHNLDVFGNPLLDVENQVYMNDIGRYRYGTTKNFKQYLKSKGLKLKTKSCGHVEKGYNVLFGFPNISDQKFNNIINEAKDAVKNGASLSLNITGIDKNYDNIHSPITLQAPPGVDYDDFIFDSLAGHAVYITGIEEDRFVVSSWGQKYYIDFADLIASGQFVLIIDEIIFE